MLCNMRAIFIHTELNITYVYVSLPALNYNTLTDSDSVLQLLSKALSMESLSELLKKEHQDNAVHLKALKEKLES